MYYFHIITFILSISRFHNNFKYITTSFDTMEDLSTLSTRSTNSDSGRNDTTIDLNIKTESLAVKPPLATGFDRQTLRLRSFPPSTYIHVPFTFGRTSSRSSDSDENDATNDLSSKIDRLSLRKPLASYCDYLPLKQQQAYEFIRRGNYRLNDYLDALRSHYKRGDIVGVGAINNTRIILHFRANLYGHYLVWKEGFTMKDGTFIKCRPLNKPFAKLTISNVPPSIPNEVLLKFLVDEVQLNVLSDIFVLPAVPKNDYFCNMISWKREVYVDNNMACKLLGKNIPYGLQYDGKIYRVIFTLQENILCWKCTGSDHTVEHCADSPVPFISYE